MIAATSHRFARAYFLLQGIAGIGWWGMLLAVPSTRGWFAAEGAGEEGLLALAVADIALYAGASLLCGWRLGRSGVGPAGLLWFTCGAVWYATLTALGMALFAGAPWTGAVCMAPSAALTTHFVLGLTRGGAPCSDG